MSKIETNQVDPSTGSTLTLGTSGDTIAIPSGVTIANSGTATGFGGANTPYFQAVQSTDVGLTANTATVISFNSEPFDSGSLFNNSNGRFVMDSTNAGKYFIYACF